MYKLSGLLASTIAACVAGAFIGMFVFRALRPFFLLLQQQ